MNKYLNYLTYLGDIEKVVVNDKEQCVVFYGRTTAAEDHIGKSKRISIAGATLILSPIESNSDSFIATWISQRTCRTSTIKSTDELMDFLRVANVGPSTNKTLLPPEFNDVVSKNKEWFRNFTVGLLAIKEVQMTLYDEDLQVIKCRYKNRDITIYGMHTEDRDYFHCFTKGIDIMMGMFEIITEDVENIDEFKKALLHGFQSSFCTMMN